MRRIFILMLAIALTSCGTMRNTIYKSSDRFKDETTYRLEQQLQAYKADEKNIFRSSPKHSTVGASYFGQVKANGQNQISLDLIMDYRLSAYLPDSTLYMQVDENFFEVNLYRRMVKQYTKNSTSTTTDSKSGSSENGEATSSTSTTTFDENTYELITSSYFFPPEVVQAIAESKKLVYRMYIGKRPVDIKPNALERKKAKKLINKTLKDKV